MSLPEHPDDQRLLLNALPGIGPVAARRLSEAFGGDLGRALRATREELLAVRGIGPAAADTLLGARFDWKGERERATRLGLRILAEGQPGWPEALSELWDPPLALYAEGGATPDRRAVGLVGTRRCTPYGEGMARSMAADLARAGWWVVSGLALGIDCAAHEGALEGGGRTAAVLGHGLDQTHPREARALRRRIVEAGAVLSEFPLGRPPDRQSFPQRNRLVAALCRAVVVIETDLGGGSQITARFAGELGRTLCAVPGRADSPASRGCHALIRDGATLVTGADQVLEELGEAPSAKAGGKSADADGEKADESGVMRHFAGGYPHDAETLARAAGIGADEAAATLTLLEIEGRLRRRLDGRHEKA
jgi:DNA processing protein